MEIERCDLAWDWYDGVWITNQHFSGHLHATLPTVFRSIARVCHSTSGVTDFYIGVASGLNYHEALKSRIRDKRSWGVTHMYLLYASSSERYTRAMEKAIECHWSGREQGARMPVESFSGFSVPLGTIQNRRGGGGGRKGQSGNYFLYLAFRKP